MEGATRYRLRELTWAGYSPDQIAAVTGYPAGTVEGWYDHTRLTRSEHRAIERAYRRLIPDVDEVAVERVLDGDLPPERLNVAERREAVRQLRLGRRSHRQIAAVVHVTPRTAARILGTLGLAGCLEGRAE